MHLTSDHIKYLISRLGDYSEDIEWSENCKPPVNDLQFALEAIFVICNSGMRFQVAREIFEKVKHALLNNRPASTVFNHDGKCGAIQHIWDNRTRLYNDFKNSSDILEFCVSLPWIGEITKYHLAKNFGADVCKPDVHLQRIADLSNENVHEMCKRLSIDTGYKVSTIDIILWRSCAIGIINSHTGEIT